MKCNKCNQEIPDNSKFCLHCGAKVEVVDSIMCSKCGYKNPLDAKFCTECGAQLVAFICEDTKISNWHSIRGLIEIRKDSTGKLYLSDKHGVITDNWTYDEIKPINKYVAIVSNNGNYGVIHCCGSLVIPCVYQHIKDDSFKQNVLECKNATNEYKYYNINQYMTLRP